MPWCPKCKNEYVKGIKTCSECKCDLVDTLEEVVMMEEEQATRPLVVGEEKLLQELVDLLQENDISSARITHNDEDDVFEVYVDKDEQLKATKIANAYAYQYTKAMREEKKQEVTYSYVSASEKSEDAKSSGIVLITAGAIGIVALVLLVTGVFPIKLGVLSMILTSVLMGGFFLVLLIMGIVSMKKNKELKGKVDEEKEIQERIQKYADEFIIADKIDEEVQKDFDEPLEKVDDQRLFYKRTELIRNMLNDNIEGINEGMIDQFIENHYDDIFEETEE